jgi:trimeric autotransporter adhesin
MRTTWLSTEMKLRWLILALLISPLWGATYYVSQSAQTPFSGGTACNGHNTSAYTFLSSGSYTAGDTIYLCGTITNEVSMGHSGTSGSRINVIFDTGASITRGVCDSSYCFNFNGQSYITLSGGSQPCGWNTATNTSEGTCNGFIEATANGSPISSVSASMSGSTATFTDSVVFPLGTFGNGSVLAGSSFSVSGYDVSWTITGGGGTTSITATSSGTSGLASATGGKLSPANLAGGGAISCSGTNNEIENLGIYNIFVYVDQSGVIPSNNSAWIDSINSNGGCTIHDNQMHDAEWGIEWGTTGSSSGPWNIYNNDIYHMSHGPTIAQAATATLSGINIYGNHIHDGNETPTPSDSCPNHTDGIHFFGPNGSSGGLTVSANIYNNIFDGNTSTLSNGNNCLTAWIFMEGTSQPGSGGINIYNNKLTSDATASTIGSDGFITIGMTNNSGNFVNILNNTMACASANWSPAGMEINLASYNITDNAFLNCSPAIWNEGVAVFNMTYNAVDQATCSGGGNGCYHGGNGGTNLQTGSLDLNTALYPTSGSSAIGNGTNLTSDCSTFTSLCSDLAGNSRPSTGNWTIGAYNQAGSGSATEPTCSANCAGTYTGSTTATFANPNSGTTIMCYTTTGTTPVTNGSGTGCTTGTSLSGSTGNVTVSASETVKVVAGTSTLTDSSVLSEAYTINPATSVSTTRQGQAVISGAAVVQ